MTKKNSLLDQLYPNVPKLSGPGVYLKGTHRGDVELVIVSQDGQAVLATLNGDIQSRDDLSIEQNIPPADFARWDATWLKKIDDNFVQYLLRGLEKV